MGGKFQFSRDVPSIGAPIDFENRRRSHEIKRQRRKKEKNDFELEKLHKINGETDIEIGTETQKK